MALPESSGASRTLLRPRLRQREGTVRRCATAEGGRHVRVRARARARVKVRARVCTAALELVLNLGLGMMKELTLILVVAE